MLIRKWNALRKFPSNRLEVETTSSFMCMYPVSCFYTLVCICVRISFLLFGPVCFACAHVACSLTCPSRVSQRYKQPNTHQTSKDKSIDPVEMVETMLGDIVKTGQHHTRYSVRMNPMQKTCKADIESLKEIAKPLIDKHFEGLPAGSKVSRTPILFCPFVFYTCVCFFHNSVSSSLRSHIHFSRFVPPFVLSPFFPLRCLRFYALLLQQYCINFHKRLANDNVPRVDTIKAIASLVRPHVQMFSIFAYFFPSVFSLFSLFPPSSPSSLPLLPSHRFPELSEWTYTNQTFASTSKSME